MRELLGQHGIDTKWYDDADYSVQGLCIAGFLDAASLISLILYVLQASLTPPLLRTQTMT